MATRQEEKMAKRLLKLVNSSVYNIEKPFGRRQLSHDSKSQTLRKGEQEHECLSVDKFQPTLPTKAISNNPNFFRTVVRERIRAKAGETIDMGQWEPIQITPHKGRIRSRRCSQNARSHSNRRQLPPILNQEEGERLIITSKRAFFNEDSKAEIREMILQSHNASLFHSLRETVRHSSRPKINQISL